jgi:hypothetical protein
MVEYLVSKLSSGWEQMTLRGFLGLRILAACCLLPMVALFFVYQLQSTSGQFAFLVWLSIVGLLIHRAKHLPAPATSEEQNSSALLSNEGFFVWLYLASGVLLASAVLAQSLLLVYASTLAFVVGWILLRHRVLSFREGVWALLLTSLAIGFPEPVVRWPINTAARTFSALLDFAEHPSYLSSSVLQTGSNFVELPFFDGPLNVTLVVCIAVSLAIYRGRSLLHSLALSMSAFATSVLAIAFVLACCYAFGISVRTESTGLVKLFILRGTFLTFSTALLLPFDRLLCHLLEEVPRADPQYRSIYQVVNAFVAWPNAVEDSELQRASSKPRGDAPRTPVMRSLALGLQAKLLRICPVERCLLAGVLVFIGSGIGSCVVTLSCMQHDARARALLESWSASPMTASAVSNRLPTEQSTNERQLKIARCQWVEAKRKRPRLEIVTVSGRGIQLRHSVSYQTSRFWIVEEDREPAWNRVTSNSIESAGGRQQIVEVLVDEFGSRSYRIKSAYEKVQQGKKINLTMSSQWDSGRSLSEEEQQILIEKSLQTWRLLSNSSSQAASDDTFATGN